MGEPLTAVKDTILVARELLTGKHINTENKFFKIINLAFPLPKTEIPIYATARGNKMLSLAGDYGDSVLPTTLINYLETSVSMVKKKRRVQRKKARRY